jgi:hypothetical protein
MLDAGEPRDRGPSSDFLSHMASVYDVVASHDPRLDLIPLHPFAGWTLGMLSWSSIHSAALA